MSNDSRRPLKHRPRERNFRFAEYSKPQSKAPKDDRTISRKGPQVEIVRPKWNSTTPMTFRPLPMTCAEDPSVFDPTRLSTDEFDFSDFWRGLPAVKYVGIDQKFTFLAYDPSRVYNNNYNPRTDNPYHVLFNAVQDAVKKTGEAIVNGKDVMTGKWSPLINEGPQKAFNAPTKIYFLQGLIYESDNELYIKGNALPKGLRDGDLPQIIEISKSAGDALAKKLNMLNPDYNGDTDVEYQAAMYLYGDIVDLAHGSFLTLYNKDKHSNVTDAFENLDEEDQKDNSTFQSWGVAINPEFSYISRRLQCSVPADLSKYAEQIRDKVVDWNELLYFPPDEEICLWMAQAFRSMPALLEFGWADHPKFFTDEVVGVLSNRVQASKPGAQDEQEDEVEFSVSRKPKPAQKSTSLRAPVEELEEEVEEDELDDTVADSDVPADDVDSADDELDLDDIDDVDGEDELEDTEPEAVEEAPARKAPAPKPVAVPPTRIGPTGGPPAKAKVMTKPTPKRA